MRQTTGKWRENNWEVLVRQLDEVEKRERQERENTKPLWTVEGENPEETQNQKRLAALQDTTEQRQKTLVREAKKIREAEDKYISLWEKQNRSTIEGIRTMEDNQKRTQLQREQQRILAEIASYR